MGRALLLVMAFLSSSESNVLSADDGASPSRRVEVHLYGADIRDGAPLAPWYHDIGITDVWLYPLQGAFPQDQRPETQRSVQDLVGAGTLDAYRKRSIRYWWFERPVPDYLYAVNKGQAQHIWDDSPEADTLWQGICTKIATIYPGVREAGFEGVLYDTEAYYSYKGDPSGKDKPWVWAGHEDQYGEKGNYYKRGKQIGAAIHKAWPRAKVILVYAFGYESERWWYQGIRDGGVDFYLGPEHTYGAGPAGDLGGLWYQSWWQGRDIKQTCDWKREQFPFIPDNQHIMAGLFPIDFGAKKPNYRAKFFREQLLSAASHDPAGPIPVWLWPQGAFSSESWETVEYADGDDAESYLGALREFSQAFADQPEAPSR